MRDGPGWGQRAAEETFGIDQFFRSEKLQAIMRTCSAGTQGGAGVTLFWAATLIAIIIAPRRACAIRVPLRPAASEGEGTFVFVPTAGVQSGLCRWHL